MDLKSMIARALGAEPREESEKDADQPYNIPNRRDKRRSKKHYNPLRSRQYNVPRQRTGRPDWFRGMQFRAAVRKQLSLINVSDLDITTDHVIALDAIGVRNVWQLSQADRADLLKAKGIGPVALKKIRADLVKRSVPVIWKAE